MTLDLEAGSTTAGQDYTDSDPPTVTINAGDTSGSVTFSLAVLQDTVYEGNEALRITGSLPASSPFPTPAAATLTITDDDPAPTTITLSLSHPVSTEGDEPFGLVITATLDAARDSLTRVHTQLIVSAISEINIIAGQLSADAQAISVTITDNNIYHGDRTFPTTSTLPDNIPGLTVVETSWLLKDNDSAPTVALSVDTDGGMVGEQDEIAEDAGQTTVAVGATVQGSIRFADDQTVTLAVGESGDSAEKDTDYTAANITAINISGGTQTGAATFTLTPIADSLAEGDEALTVSGTYGSDGAAATSAMVTIIDDVAPTLPDPDDLTFVAGKAIPAETLPAASGGNAPLTYSVSPALANGLSFDAASRQITGAPTSAAAAVTYTYEVTDNDGDAASQTFTITVIANDTPTLPDPDDLTFVAGKAIPAETLPAASGGNAPLTYSVSPAMANGLSFDAASRRITGTPTSAAAAVTYTYEVTDNDGDAASQTFTITVIEDLRPFFSGDIADQTYTAGSPIPLLQLPAATSGDPPLTYALTPVPPDGLTFDPDARTITGTPTTAQPATRYTLTVTDVDSDTDTSTFAIEVRPPASISISTLEFGLAAFGRTLASMTVDSIDERFNTFGRAESGVYIAGNRLAFDTETAVGHAPAAIACGDTAQHWPGNRVSSIGGASMTRCGSSHDRRSESERLRNSRFQAALGGGAAPLNESGARSRNRLTLWGNLDHRAFSGRTDANASLEGSATAAHVGVDYNYGARWLAGVALSRAAGAIGLKDADGNTGALTPALTSVVPYVNWSPRAGLSLWGLGGRSRGEMAVTVGGESARTTDLGMTLFAAGGRRPMWSVGRMRLVLKADAFRVRMQMKLIRLCGHLILLRGGGGVGPVPWTG